jgi:hypothetical protein
VSAINTSPDEPDFMTSRPSITSVLPRLMVVTGGTMVLIGAWLLGSETQSTLGTVLVVAGALDALVALVLARRG